MIARSRISLLAATLVLALVAVLPVTAAPPKKSPAKPAAPQKFMARAEKGQTLYATFVTSKGTFVAKLYSKEAPATVTNFVGLATGEKPWVDPATGAKMTKPLYTGTIFHRVIPGFMIQGGDPTGTGMGAPGYRFNDEFNGIEFTKKGLLAMANSGPNTNGCQFFVTVAKPTYLNGKHTIFGEIVSGYPVVEAIAGVERDANDRPAKAVVIKRIEISDKAPAAPKGGK